MPDPAAQTPTPEELIQEGVDALVALRPKAADHIPDGVYGNVFAGWRAQAALMLRRDADFAKQGRIKFAEGLPLRFNAGSEHDLPTTLEATKAIGQVILTRESGRLGGTIRKGARFTRPADTSSQELYGDAQYVAAYDVHVVQGQTEVEVPLDASREGAFANRPLTSTTATELEIADNILDRQAWTVSSYEMGGGSDEVTDDEIRRYAKAYESGKHGPNIKAALTGAFKAGARHAVAVDDTSQAALVVYIADSSWGSSTRWGRTIRKSLYDLKYVGFGCKVLCASTVNEIVGVEASVKVRRPEYLYEKTSLELAVQKAVRSYFDDRPDWNRWKSTSLRGHIARADRRLLLCSSVTVKRPDGTIVDEPSARSSTHFMLLNNAVKVSFT